MTDDKLSDRPVGFKIPEGDLEDLDRVVEFEKRSAPGHSVSRSSIVRAALRLFLNERMKHITPETNSG